MSSIADRARCSSIWVLGVVSSVVLAGCVAPRPPDARPPHGHNTTTTSASTTTATSSTTTTLAPATTTTAAPSTTTTTPPIPPGSEGTTRRITDGNHNSALPAVSADGRFVAYHSNASNLVPDDTNGFVDVFVWDASTGTTTRITDGNDDSSGPAISADGRYVTFVSEASDLVPDDTNGQWDVFRWDATTGSIIHVTDGNDLSTVPTISADGRFVTYFSEATDLVPDDTNGYWDVFVWDAVTGTTARITDGDNHSVLPAISADGRYIAYTSYASNLVPDDINGAGDVFVWDAATGATTRITNGNGNSLRPSISTDGRYVTYNSHASNLVPDDANGAGDVFVWDGATGTTTRITDGNADSGEPAISADGHHVTYNSFASDLVADDTNGATDVFAWNATTGTTIRVTRGNGESFESAISADGTLITFMSQASDLVDGDTDTNGWFDVYVWEPTG